MLGNIKNMRACIITHKGKKYFAINRFEMSYIKDEEYPLCVKEFFLDDIEENFVCQYNHHHEKIIELIFSELESAIDRDLKRRKYKG